MSPREEAEQRPHGLLIVDDEPAIRESLELTLGGEYRTFTASSGEEGLTVLAREAIACVIADQVMPGMSGVEFLDQVRERDPSAIRMMLTGYADLPSLVQAINESQIYRYIPKPWEPDELRLDVRRALEAYELGRKNEVLAEQLARALDRLRAENVYLRREVEKRYSFEGIIGESPAMQRVFDLTQKVAETATTVLLTGETGTGKDLIARAIHYTGPRKARRFVTQNCGALPDTLLESELFGHRRGAFTGATDDKKGLFETADGARSSSTRSARRLRTCRCGCCGSSRTARSGRSATPRLARWTSASSRPPTVTSRRRSSRGAFGRTCSTG